MLQLGVMKVKSGIQVGRDIKQGCTLEMMMFDCMLKRFF
jgi:hypothetical protein